jgi:hypothetical protein
MTAVAGKHRATSRLSKVADEECPQAVLVDSGTELLQVADEQGMPEKAATVGSHHLVASSFRGK